MFFDESFISMKQTNPINITNLKDTIHKIEAKTKPKSQICEMDPKFFFLRKRENILGRNFRSNKYHRGKEMDQKKGIVEEQKRKNWEAFGSVGFDQPSKVLDAETVISASLSLFLSFFLRDTYVICVAKAAKLALFCWFSIFGFQEFRCWEILDQNLFSLAFTNTDTNPNPTSWSFCGSCQTNTLTPMSANHVVLLATKLLVVLHTKFKNFPFSVQDQTGLNSNYIYTHF